MKLCFAIYLTKTKALIAHLISAFAVAYAKHRFYDVAHMSKK